LPRLLQQAIEMQGVRMGINYGLNRVRFTGPVPAGARVRARFRLAAIEDLAEAGRGAPADSAGVQITWAVTLEREREGKGEREREGERQGEGEGEAKTVLVAEWLTRRYE
jgi:acyl dehydratase